MGNSRFFLCEGRRRRVSSPAAVHLNAPTEGSLLRPRGPLTLDRLACDLPSAYVPSFASRFLPWHGFPSVACLAFGAVDRDSRGSLFIRVRLFRINASESSSAQFITPARKRT